MSVMISVILLLVAAVLGAWRLETEFDREAQSQSAIHVVEQSEYRSGK